VGHTFSNLLVHVIFGTKGRLPTIRESFRLRLYEYMSGIARTEFGRALCIGGTPNHAHGLIVLTTDVSVAEAVRKWKSISSKWVHETFPEDQDFAWQSGYGAFSVSRSNVHEVAGYIERQVEHHRKVTFEEEFVAFLNRHGIEYDPRYVWD
jgi:REP element-mobilizing transposase RayT